MMVQMRARDSSRKHDRLGRDLHRVVRQVQGLGARRRPHDGPSSSSEDACGSSCCCCRHVRTRIVVVAVAPVVRRHHDHRGRARIGFDPHRLLRCCCCCRCRSHGRGEGRTWVVVVPAFVLVARHGRPQGLLLLVLLLLLLHHVGILLGPRNDPPQQQVAAAVVWLAHIFRYFLLQSTINDCSGLIRAGAVSGFLVSNAAGSCEV
jgi:hypothetical protein